MSLIWMDGFDAYATNGQHLNAAMTSALYIQGTCSATSDTRTGRGYAIRFDLGGGNGPAGHLIKAFPVEEELIVGFAWKIERISELHTICEFRYDDQFGTIRNHLGLWMAGDGALTVGYFNASGNRVKLIDTDPNFLFPNVWHFIEVRVRFHDTEGFVQVRIDGQTCISHTGRTKNPNAPAMCNVFRAGHYYLEDNTLLDVFMDDFYILNTDGEEFSDFLGDVVVHTVLPNADGSRNELQQFGGSLQHYTAVDDVPPDADVSYLYGNVVGMQELFEVDPLPTNVINVLAVSIHARSKKDAAGASGIKMACRYDDTTVLGPVEPVTTQYLTRALILEHAPDGGAWTKAKAEAMEIGFEVA